jgi:peroxiredoxin Q/BCP
MERQESRQPASPTVPTSARLPDCIGEVVSQPICHGAAHAYLWPVRESRAIATDQTNNLIMAKTIENTLKEGDKAPAFTAPTSGGGKISLADYKGRHVILYFYPKDDTPGCTKEACGFRDQFAAFEKKGAVVLGVSIDSPKAHDKFVEKFEIPFTLVSDEDKKMVQAYGVWGEKTFMGRNYLGTHRVTFLIGPDGKIKRIWPKVKPEEHATEVLAAI